jgi:CHAD domain-containing protein
MRQVTNPIRLAEPSSMANRPSWRKSDPLVLPPEGSAEDAIVEAVSNGLAHLTNNEACVLARSHPEGVHQMRVAVRRLRSRIALYNGLLLPENKSRKLTGELKWLIGSLGPARDWDVFVTETMAPALKLLPDDRDLAFLRRHAVARQDRGYKIAQAALRSRRYARLKTRLAAWAETRAWRQAADGLASKGALDAPVRLFAARVLEARHRKVLRHGEHIHAMDAGERHQLRIQIKKLRYAVEFLESLFSGNAVKPYLAALKRLQDSLGAMNDLFVARTLTEELCRTTRGTRKKVRMAYASGLIVGCAAHQHEQATQLPAAWTQFTSREAFWELPP